MVNVPRLRFRTSVLESLDLARDCSADGELAEPFIEGRSRTIKILDSEFITRANRNREKLGGVHEK
jgi:hypothetical protein